MADGYWLLAVCSAVETRTYNILKDSIVYWY